jgi:hypothetical protein
MAMAGFYFGRCQVGDLPDGIATGSAVIRDDVGNAEDDTVK